MVMPSEDEIRSDVGGGNVTHPFVTETYRCVAAYETKDTKNKAFKVALDEKVDVLIKDKAGWWLVENEAKQMAWFPAPYLESLDDDDGDEDETDGTSGRGSLYTAVRSYKATKDDEITVTIGATVEVLQKSDNGWWLIRYNGKAGYIPTMYLQPYSRPHIRMAAAPSILEQQSNLSHSHGNLLQLPPTRSYTPLQPDSRHKSRSLDVLSEPPPAPVLRRPAAPANTSAVSSANYPPPPPTITVEMDGDEGQPRSLRANSQGSFESDSTDFSLSDDLSSSSASSTLNLSLSYAEQLRLSRTPPPMPWKHLTSMDTPQGKIIPSVSDPNLYKGPSTPKVPPRPQAQEILSRCTSITRKNAGKGGLAPTQTEIISR